MIEVKQTVKNMIAAKGITLGKMVEEYNARTGAVFTQQAFSYKIHKETLKANELQVVCDILGFSPVIAKGNVELPMTPLKEVIESIFEANGVTKEDVRRIFNERTGAKFVQPTFAYKVNHETFKVNELQVVLDILGYELKIRG
ncbi:hypothetical protein SELR_pSRC300700 (plasmid) [Selenomonas ruminantium subsp. lactilytica TAM6421]|uniref:Uncharacterized protein n=1 Tax=Selenomonas ruminantium subsp. lactilytica (strain NBRC 103574 / TAM6421) TaxID=927704 RepID=I0GWK6_SELRL|nr:hypothetical protein [Selenomonas ruminantium]BAL85143.1 hypothetical protein SELR_pSRC300700 [Selenomonas ruminantium subsp. lactilytica TAM6421]